MAYDIGPRISLKGETEFNRSLQAINANLKEYGSELKVVQSAQAAQGKTTENLAQENAILQKRYETQSAKLKLYTSKLEELTQKQKEQAKAIEEASKKFGENSKEVSAAQKAYDSTTSQIDKLKVAINETKSYMISSQGAIKKNSDEMKKLATNGGEAGKGIKDAGDSADKAQGDLKEMGRSAEKAGDGFTVMKGAVASALGQAFHDALSRAKDAIVDFGKSMITTAADVKAQNAQYEQTFGDMQTEATQAISEVAKQTGILDTRLKSSATGIYAFAKASGADTPQAMSLMKEGLQAAADTAAYYDRSLEDSTETLQSFLKGNFANDAALGVSCTETTRNAKAMELFGQKYNDLSEIQKQQTLLKMVVDSQKASGAFGQASREMDGLENVTGNLKETWRQFQAEVGTPFLEALIPVIKQLTENFKKWKDTIDWDAFALSVQNFATILIDFITWVLNNGQSFISILAGIGTGFAVFKTLTFVSNLVGTFQSLWAVMQTGQGVMGALNAVMAANPFGAIAVVIGTVVTALVALYQNCEWFRDGVNAVFTAVGNVFNEIFGGMVEWFTVTLPQSMSSFWNSLKTGWDNMCTNISNKWSEAWNKIKAVFDTIIGFVKNNWAGLLLLLVNPFAGAFKLLYDNCDGFRSFVDKWVKKISNAIGNVFGGMWKKAKNWGKDLINGFVEGIKSGFSWLADTVGNVAKTVANFLHFSVPEKGPLKDFDESGGDMMDVFIQGMDSKRQALIQKAHEMAEVLNFSNQSSVAVGGDVMVTMPVYLSGRIIQKETSRVSVQNADALKMAKGG